MINRRLVVAAALLALTVGACAKGQSYGCDPSDKKCLAGVSTKLPASKSPTPKKASTKPSVKPSASKTSQAPQPAGYKGKTYTFVIKDNSGYKPNQLGVYETDTIVVKNQDSGKHQFALYKPEEFDKILAKSPELKPGQSWTFKVTLEPGRYNFRDLVVPYIQSGHFNVAPAPKA